jgi:acetyl esterase/lipase
MKLTPFAAAFSVVALLCASAFAQQNREGVAVEQDVQYGTAGDLPLKLDVIRPEKQSDKLRPAIVWIHGGGWQGGNKSSGAGRLRELVASGDYVGFSVGYRLTDVASWPAQIHDCKAAIRWIRASAKTYGVDPQRIGVWGSSAGGHLVSMLGTSGDVKSLDGENGSADASSRVACVVDFCGPSDFIAFGEKSAGMRAATSPVGKLLGGELSEKQDVAKEASPITYVSKDDPPFIIFHGTEDRTVPLDQADRFHAALAKAGVNSTLVHIEGGGHGFGGPEVNARVKAFLEKHLLGKDVEVSGEPIKQASQ